MALLDISRSKIVTEARRLIRRAASVSSGAVEERRPMCDKTASEETTTHELFRQRAAALVQAAPNRSI
jgi:hypothetical protein